MTRELAPVCGEELPTSSPTHTNTRTLHAQAQAQSTDGTEPSHMHSREDLSCSRGYELWLLAEARARNPAIATYALAWGAPGWLNEGAFYGNDTITYWVNFLDCVVQRSGLPGPAQ